MAFELPFSTSEYNRRLREARRAMAEAGADAMLFFDPSSVYHLSGFSTVNLWDTVCLIVFADREPVTVFRRFERERFRASSRFGSHLEYPHDGDCITALREALCGTLRPGDTVAVELSRYLDILSSRRLHASLGEFAVCECTGSLNDTRLVKSEEELAVIRKAAAVTDRGIEAGRSAVREGATDYEICAAITHALISHGSDFMCIQPVVAVGRRTGMAHSSTAGEVVRGGDSVFLEMGACLHRYTSPLMRTVAAGTPSGDAVELADLSSRALDAMIATMRAGVRACDVAEAGARVLKPALSGLDFHFVWGYSVGAGFPPSWLEETGFFLNADNHRELAAAMVFHLPLMLRIPGVAGAGFSETVVVTPNGAEILSGLPRQL